MTVPCLAYLVICCLVCQHRGLALPLVAARGGLDSEPRSSQDHRLIESADNGSIGNDPWPVEASANEVGEEKARLLTQHQLQQLLVDNLHALPNGRYLLKPIGELAETVGGTPTALLYKDDKPWTARARRYAGSQSFLRFGRRLKRPRDTKETAFLRFGRTTRHRAY